MSMLGKIITLYTPVFHYLAQFCLFAKFELKCIPHIVIMLSYIYIVSTTMVSYRLNNICLSFHNLLFKYCLQIIVYTVIKIITHLRHL